MKIDGDGYSLTLDESSNTIAISGSLRLNGLEEYAPILDTLRAGTERGDQVAIDLRELSFLNSSGIAMLSKFVIEARGRESLSLTIIGSEQIPWQTKSLKNLQRLWPAVTLTIS